MKNENETLRSHNVDDDTIESIANSLCDDVERSTHDTSNLSYRTIDNTTHVVVKRSHVHCVAIIVVLLMMLLTSSLYALNDKTIDDVSHVDDHQINHDVDIDTNDVVYRLILNIEHDNVDDNTIDVISSHVIFEYDDEHIREMLQ